MFGDLCQYSLLPKYLWGQKHPDWYAIKAEYWLATGHKGLNLHQLSTTGISYQYRAQLAHRVKYETFRVQAHTRESMRHARHSMYLPVYLWQNLLLAISQALD